VQPTHTSGPVVFRWIGPAGIPQELFQLVTVALARAVDVADQLGYPRQCLGVQRVHPTASDPAVRSARSSAALISCTILRPRRWNPSLLDGLIDAGIAVEEQSISQQPLADAHELPETVFIDFSSP
jgi:hypothetical protein